MYDTTEGVGYGTVASMTQWRVMTMKDIGLWRSDEYGTKEGYDTMEAVGLWHSGECNTVGGYDNGGCSVMAQWRVVQQRVVT